jgi:hypothetical protein
MVDTSTILEAAALPMHHTQNGVFKVGILGGLLLAGWCIATVGLYRWYKMNYDDRVLLDARDELIEERQRMLEGITDESLSEDQKWEIVNREMPFNEEDYVPPLRSHFLNYLFFFGGIAIAASGVITWLVIPD